MRFRGKLHYLHTDEQAAHDWYLLEAANLHTGGPRNNSVDTARLTVKNPADCYVSQRSKGTKSAAVHFVWTQPID